MRFLQKKAVVMARNIIADRFHIDPPLMVGVLLMSALGLLVLYSASEQSFDTILYQGLRLLVGLVAMVIVAQIPPYRIAHWAPILYFIALSLLVIVLFLVLVAGYSAGLTSGSLDFNHLRS